MTSNDSSSNDCNDEIYRSWVTAAIGDRDYASLSVAVWEEDAPGGAHATCTIRQGARHPPQRKSSYEIGSTTKVYTSLLLALATVDPSIPIQLETRVVDLLEPMASIGPLPHFPREITLRRLASHTSGMPRLPSDWNFYWNMLRRASNPYSGYHTPNLATTLRKYRDKHPQDIGSQFVYSNLGVGLLGHALGQGLAGSSSEDNGPTHKNASVAAYEALIHNLIADPLKLPDTTTNVTSELLPGYGPKGQPVPHWTFDALAGAGALHSTLEDVVQFGVANLRAARRSSKNSTTYDLTRMEQAMRLCHQRQADVTETDQVHISVGLGWIRTVDKTLGDGTITLYWHNGGTAGSSTYLGWEPQTGVVVVVLANTDMHQVDATPLGQRILRHAVERRLPAAEMTLTEEM